MLHDVMSYMANKLNNTLRHHLNAADDLLVLAPLVGLDGKRSKRAKNVLAFFVTGISDEVAGHRAPVPETHVADRPIEFPPFLGTIHCAVASTYETQRYEEGLKTLGLVREVIRTRHIWNSRYDHDFPDSLSQIQCTLQPHDRALAAAFFQGLGVPAVPFIDIDLRVMADQRAVELPEP